MSERKVTNAMIEELRQRHATGESYRELAQRFNISHTTVRGYVCFESVSAMNARLAANLDYGSAHDYQMDRLTERGFHSVHAYRKYLARRQNGSH